MGEVTNFGELQPLPWSLNNGENSTLELLGGREEAMLESLRREERGAAIYRERWRGEHESPSG